MSRVTRPHGLMYLCDPACQAMPVHSSGVAEVNLLSEQTPLGQVDPDSPCVPKIGGWISITYIEV